MTEAVNALDFAIKNNHHITIEGDYDVDGLTCILEWKRFFNLIGFDNYTILQYTKRTHSIDPAMASTILQKRSGLCIICDTGSSEPETLQYLNSICPVIVIDHHRGSTPRSILNDKLVVVNPTMWEDGVQMSAGCVTYEVIMEWVMQHQTDDFEYFERMLSFYPFLSLYADSAYGPNDYCYQLYQTAQDAVFPPEFSFAEKNFISTKRFVLFSVAPPINAAFRNNRLDLINKLFLTRTNLLSYERADLLDDLEILRTTMRKHINRIVELVEPKMIGNIALVDLTGYLNQGVPNDAIWANKGLIANKIADQYKCLCICIVNTGGEYSLSVRDYHGRDVLPLMQAFYKVGGHPSAFGGTMTVHEVLSLRENLAYISKRLCKPTKREVLRFLQMTDDDLNRVALHNEFKHPNEVTLVSVPKSLAKLEPTPASFGQRYYQYHVPLKDNSKIYVKQEDFDDPNQPAFLIQLYKGKRLMGSQVANA